MACPKKVPWFESDGRVIEQFEDGLVEDGSDRSVFAVESCSSY
jgi:hypothetical protein